MSKILKVWTHWTYSCFPLASLMGILANWAFNTAWLTMVNREKNKVSGSKVQKRTIINHTENQPRNFYLYKLPMETFLKCQITFEMETDTFGFFVSLTHLVWLFIKCLQKQRGVIIVILWKLVDDVNKNIFYRLDSNN